MVSHSLFTSRKVMGVEQITDSLMIHQNFPLPVTIQNPHTKPIQNKGIQMI